MPEMETSRLDRLLADLDQLRVAMTADMVEREEAALREMLSRWTLDEEPVLAYRYGLLLGLTVRTPVGACAPIIVVRRWEDEKTLQIIRKVRYVGSEHHELRGETAMYGWLKDNLLYVQFDNTALGKWAYGWHGLPKNDFESVE